MFLIQTFVLTGSAGDPQFINPETGRPRTMTVSENFDAPFPGATVKFIDWLVGGAAISWICPGEFDPGD